MRQLLPALRNGKPFRKVIDIPALYLHEKSDEDIILAGGDIIYVHSCSRFLYLRGSPTAGAYRIERGMTIMQALAQGGGPYSARQRMVASSSSKKCRW